MTFDMHDRRAIEAIRAQHLRGGIQGFEDHPEEWRLHWDRAWLDPGGTVFGPGPYVKLPITEAPQHRPEDQIVIRVRAPERLRRRLARRMGLA